ncbi:MAG: YihA family ribosome biogenesis GTP-binding protein [Firmicutes bacterium]|nr:YihA family ribosome biogenesis GTP-binding protein [Bacillota bacterium]
MVPKEARYVCSAVTPSQYPGDRLPEVALVGRSNVGKSSLINALVGRRSLARTSSRPGRTQTINFYLVDEAFYLVDLPGYGFANVPKRVREAWGPMIEGYLLGRRELVGIIMLVDARHPPNRNDVQMADWLHHHGLAFGVVATKVDKVSRGQWQSRLRELGTALRTDVVRAFSAKTGHGKEEVLQLIQEFLRECEH